MEILLYNVYKNEFDSIIYRNAKGELHRTNGPAIEWQDGIVEWRINGKELTKTEFINRTTVQEFSMDDIANKIGIPVELLKIKK